MKKNDPQITVCIPLYNGEAFIVEAIESVLRQEDIDVEIIISDDGSTDRSMSFVEPYLNRANITLYKNPCPSGMVGNWNYCASLVRTKYFTVLHQDDMHGSGFLRKTLDCLDRDQSVGIVFTERWAIGRSGESIVDDKSYMRKKFLGDLDAQGVYVWSPEKLARALLVGSLLCCPAAVYRREVFMKLGYFSATYRFVQDWEYWLRACFANVRIAIINEPLFHYRMHGANATIENKKDLNKYVERKKLLDWAIGEAMARGWATEKDKADAHRLTSKIITWDMAEDLSKGWMEDFEAKYMYGKKSIEGFDTYLPAKWMYRMSVLGPRVGDLAIGFAKRVLARL